MKGAIKIPVSELVERKKGIYFHSLPLAKLRDLIKSLCI
jgi:hypothetical protein